VASSGGWGVGQVTEVEPLHAAVVRSLIGRVLISLRFAGQRCLELLPFPFSCLHALDPRHERSLRAGLVVIRILTAGVALVFCVIIIITTTTIIVTIVAAGVIIAAKAPVVTKAVALSAPFHDLPS
jgi:hypothetical protein